MPGLCQFRTILVHLLQRLNLQFLERVEEEEWLGCAEIGGSWANSGH